MLPCESLAVRAVLCVRMRRGGRGRGAFFDCRWSAPSVGSEVTQDTPVVVASSKPVAASSTSSIVSKLVAKNREIGRAAAGQVASSSSSEEQLRSGALLVEISSRLEISGVQLCFLLAMMYLCRSCV